MVWCSCGSRATRRVSRHVDYRGVVTLSGAIVAVTLAIDRGPSWTESEPGACRLPGRGRRAARAFVVLERRVESPLVDLPTFRATPS